MMVSKGQAFLKHGDNHLPTLTGHGLHHRRVPTVFVPRGRRIIFDASVDRCSFVLGGP